MIYFIQGKLTKLIKIGVVINDVNQRLKALQSGSPDILELLGVREDLNYEDETILHGLLKDHRAHGEWFLPDPEVLEKIEELLRNKPELKKKPPIIPKHLKTKLYQRKPDRIKLLVEDIWRHTR